MMEDRELIDTMRLVTREALADLHTATIARVTAVNATTIDCQPVINRVRNGESYKMPLLADVPPIFLCGGDDYDAMPVAEGDYCIVFFMERCYDRWYDGVDEIEPLELRMHDYSDGFALVGIRNLAGAITIPEERTMTGVTRMGTANPSDMMALASKVLEELNEIKTDLDNLKTWADSHTHSGVTSGPGSTGAPVSESPEPHTPASVASAYVKAD